MNKQNSCQLGLIGWPVEHSLSPRLHNAALQGLKLAGSYKLYAIPPLPGGEAPLQEMLALLREGKLQGLNVTIPHKQSVLPYLDALTPAAKSIGAVNTVISSPGRLTGDNTDAPSFLNALKQFMKQSSIVIEQDRKSALILGAGGSARAVCYALLQDDWAVSLAARRTEQAKLLAAALGSPDSVISTLPLNAAGLAQASPALIVNATPVGMTPKHNRSPWPEDLRLPDSAIVYDLVYAPQNTQLVQQARQKGLAASSGLGMLIEQAALSFERWTGQTAPRELMRKAVSLPMQQQML